MKTANEIQMEIETLPPQEYIKLVKWFSEQDRKAWDQELIKDSQSGKLDFLLEEAMNEKKNGQLTDRNQRVSQLDLSTFTFISS